jgi:hypothetical protein
MKFDWVREAYTVCCTRQKWVSMIQGWYLETRKDEGGFERRRCPLRRGEEHVLRTLLKCLETRKPSELFFGVENGLLSTKRMVYKRTTNSTDAVELRHIGKYLYKVTHKWENKINKISGNTEGEGRFLVIRKTIM